MGIEGKDGCIGGSQIQQMVDPGLSSFDAENQGNRGFFPFLATQKANWPTASSREGIDAWIPFEAILQSDISTDPGSDGMLQGLLSTSNHTDPYSFESDEQNPPLESHLEAISPLRFGWPSSQEGHHSH